MSPIFIGPQSSSRTSTPAMAYRTPLLNGEQGTAQTIALMRQLVDDALADPSFVRQAIDIVRSVAAFNEFGEAEALYNWVKRNIRFTKDPVTKEKLYPPQELLKIRAGDCDDISMLLGAFLLALGYPARLITVSANPGQPQEFSHVYVEAEIPAGSGQWVPMDAARLDSQFGAEPPRYFRKRAWSLTEDSHQDLSGCGCRTRLSGLSGYATLGQFDWNSIIQQGLQEVPQIIAVSSGQSSQVRTPQGVVATGPYSSFVTPNTPGYGVPPAGYLAVGSSWQPYLPLIIGGALLLLFLRK